MKTLVIACVGFALGGSLLAAPSAQAPAQPAPHASAQEPAPATAPPAPPPVPIKALERSVIRDRWGVEIDSIQLTAGGYMLNFRYKVLDAKKAAPLFVRKTKPVLTDEKSGMVMQVPNPPTTGALRSSDMPQEGRLYFMFFANPGRYLKRYDLVTVTIGEFSVSNIEIK